MQFIYKNIIVQVIINLDANKVMAICTSADTSKYKIEKIFDETFKIVDYRDLKPINFTIVESIDPNNEVFSLDNAGENLSLSSIMKKICIKIDEQIG
jgi:hypothetical protein